MELKSSIAKGKLILGRNNHADKSHINEKRKAE